jgi:hypothetical protein
MTISADDVRRLLSAGDPEAVLVLIEGRTEVVSPAELDSAAYLGALRVASRDQIVDRPGDANLSERELAEQAENLNAAVRNLGG